MGISQYGDPMARGSPLSPPRPSRSAPSVSAASTTTLTARSTSLRGRDYRRRLRKAWGIVDIDDKCNGARHLVAKGLANGTCLYIDGGSADGYTTALDCGHVSGRQFSTHICCVECLCLREYSTPQACADLWCPCCHQCHKPHAGAERE